MATTVQRALQRRALLLGLAGLILAALSMVVLAPVPQDGGPGVAVPDLHLLQEGIGAAWDVAALTTALGLAVVVRASARRAAPVLSFLTSGAALAAVVIGLYLQFGEYRYACGAIEVACSGMVGSVARGAGAAAAAAVAALLLRLSTQQTAQAAR